MRTEIEAAQVIEEAGLGDYFVQFEDADEPVTAIQNLEERVDGIEEIDPVVLADLREMTS